MKILLLCLLVAPAVGYKMFQDAIPNGDMVPHPCKPNFLWQGVGHIGPGGGGKRNPFGVDFDQNEKVWDKCICEYDSDGDGRTNGEELGDPDCSWTPGTVPKVTTGLTHPGICEPVDDPNCRARNVGLGEFCVGGEELNPCLETIRQRDDVKNFTMRFPPTPVPPQETTYICQVFEFPENTTDFHMIAHQPVIDNEYVMHHILVYGCTDDVDATDTADECGMAADSCRDLLFPWAVGTNGVCLLEEYGFRAGLTGYKKFLLQAHWNNPNKVSTYTDSSGLLVYYTPTLRDHDGGMLMTGQLFLDIPPNSQDVLVQGRCPGICTNSLPWPIYVSDVLIHMHYLGNKGYIYHKRGNTTLTEMVVQDDYSYDSPVTFRYDPPIVVQPGDEIQTICHFKSTSRDVYTYMGESTNEEMCFGFITYYPKVDGLNQCLAYLDADMCAFGRGGNEVFLSCNQTEYYTTADSIWGGIIAVCDGTGKTCNPACEAFLHELSETNPCYGGSHWAYVKKELRTTEDPSLAPLYPFIASCDKTDEDNRTDKDDDDKDEDNSQGTGNGGLCPTDPNGNQGGGSTGGATVISSSIAMVFSSLLLARN